MDDLDEQVCPLCCEELDLSDQNFLPCKCGYQVCMWCWHHIKVNLNGLCPACRTPYQDDPHAFSAVDRNEIIKNKKERKQKEKEKERKEQLAAAAAAAAARSKVSHTTPITACKASVTQPTTGPQQHQQQLQQHVQQQQHQHQPQPQVQQRLVRAAARPVMQPSTVSPPAGVTHPSPAHLEKSSPSTEPYQHYDEPLNGTLRGQPLVADASPFAPRGSNLSGLDGELSDRRRRTQAPQRSTVTSPSTWDVVTRQQPTRPRKKAVPLFLASDSWGSTDDLTSSIWSVSYVSPRDSWGSWAAARPTRADDPLFDSSAMAAAAATSVLNDEVNDSHTAARRVATNGLQSVGLGDENPLLRPKPVSYGSSFWLHPGTDDSVWGAPPSRGTYL